MIRVVDTQVVVAARLRVLRRWYQHATGLMFRKRLVDEGWVFVFPRSKRWDLTNLFVFQAIDALWLDEERRVLQVRTIKPFVWRVRGVLGSRYVIELPAGAASAAGVRVGSRLAWSEEQKPI